MVTSDRDWGGWRVPGSEYDLDPFRVEREAQIIVRAPVFRKLLEEFVQHAEQEPENLSDDRQARPARPPRDLRDGRVAFLAKTRALAHACSCLAEVPGIHEFQSSRTQDVDGRDKPAMTESGKAELRRGFGLGTAPFAL
ncbi:MAG: hypothetical protein ACAH04_01945 [Methylibium sp.]